MNTYIKFCPNVFLAKCTEQHEKGEVIPVTTRHGKENECVVHNLVARTKDGAYCYSITRADGMDVQKWALRRAEKLQAAAANSEKKSTEYYQRSNSAVEGIVPGQPILVGHHSEKRHRAALEKSWNAMGKSVELSEKAEEQRSRAEYWEEKASTINLSMPESLGYFEYELEIAKAKHEGLKNGTIERLHSFSLTYAKKEVNEIEKKIQLAKRLWA